MRPPLVMMIATPSSLDALLCHILWDGRVARSNHDCFFLSASGWGTLPKISATKQRVRVTISSVTVPSVYHHCGYIWWFFRRMCLPGSFPMHTSVSPGEQLYLFSGFCVLFVSTVGYWFKYCRSEELLFLHTCFITPLIQKEYISNLATPDNGIWLNSQEE